MIDVLFIAPGNASQIYQGLATDYAAIEPPTWALLLAESCRSVGYRVGLIDVLAERLPHSEVIDRISILQPRLICIVAMGQNVNAGSVSMSGAVKLANDIKASGIKNPIGFIGSYVQALPYKTLEDEPSIDIVFGNEGVYALRNLLNAHRDELVDLSRLDGINGIGFRKDGKPFMNPPERIVPQDRLDIDLPGYAWDLLPKKEKPFDLYRSPLWHSLYDQSKRTPYATLYTSLGCQFKCSFCVEENTEIIVSNGKNKKAKNITKDDKLMAFDATTNKEVDTSIVEISTRKVSSLVEVVFSDGKKIKVTEEHPFYVNNSWKEARELLIGDKCLVIDVSDKLSFFKSNLLRKRLLARDVTPYFATQEGNARMREIVRERWSGSENPMHKEHNKKAKAEFVRKRRSGENSNFWIDGRSRLCPTPYPVEFSARLKRKIRKRDNYTCQICGVYRRTMKLPIHHIDYDKSNCSECNLITLCNCCHPKTNTNRNYWQKLLSEKMLCYGNCPHYVDVVSIRKIKKKYSKKPYTVVNFQCSPYSNYFAGYMLTHNCMINILNRNDNDPIGDAANYAVMRHWSPEFVVRQIDKLVEMGITTIRITDEMFLLNRKFYVPICEMLAERPYADKLLMWAYSRVDTVAKNPKTLELLRKAGFRWLCLGIESGDRNVRLEASKGKFEDVDIKEVVDSIHAAGIEVLANYLFGLPEDDMESMKKTMDLSLELCTSGWNAYAVMPFPGSLLYKESLEKGYELPKEYSGYSFHSYTTVPMPSKHLTPAQILKYRDEAFTAYHTYPPFLKRIEEKFGKQEVENIVKMTQIKLKRKILGD